MKFGDVSQLSVCAVVEIFGFMQKCCIVLSVKLFGNSMNYFNAGDLINGKENHGDYFFVFLMVLVPFLFLLQEPIYFLMTFVFFVFYVIVPINIRIDAQSVYFLMVFLFLVSPVIVMAQHGSSHVFYSLLTVFAFFAAKKASTISLDKLVFSSKIAYWIFALFSLLSYYLYKDELEPFSHVVAGSSTNGIPSYLLVLQISYSLFYFIENRRFPVKSAVITLLVAILGIGRGSIFSSLLVLFFTLGYNFYFDILRLAGKRLFFLFLALVFVFLVIIFNFDFVYAYLASSTKAFHGISDPYRERIFSEYVQGLSWWQLFLGGTYEGTVINIQYDDNPHIAFVRSHAYMGLFYTLIVLFSPFVLFVFKARLRLKFVFFSFIAVFIFRALSEPIVFPTTLDFYYFLILWVFVRKRIEF